MLSNLLRIFVTKKAIDTMQAESAKQLAEQGMMQEPIPQFANYKEFEEYMKRVKQEEKEWVRYYSRPMMALERAANFRAFFPIMLLFIIFIVGGSFIGLIYEALYGYEKKYILLGVIMMMIGIGFFVFMKYLQHYWENTMCLYYTDRICVKRYRKEDVVITYDEVRECIKEKKLRIHNGRFEYPYEGGYIYIYIYTWGNSVQDGFYKFMNDKCGLRMPRIEKKEKDVVRRTGIGWTLYFHMAIPFYILELFMIVVVTIGDYGLEHTCSEIIDFLIEFILSFKGSLIGLIGLFFTLLGIVFKFIFYFPAKKHFAKYKDTVKVSLF